MSKIHMLVDASNGSQSEDRHTDDYTVCGRTELDNLNLTTWVDTVNCKRCLKRIERKTP